MPTYDYKCENCNHKFEFFQSIKDNPLTKCPNCNKDSLKRLIGSGAGLIFKGSGFYLTDYKSKSENKKESSSTKKETKTESKTELNSTSKDTKTKT